MMAETITRLTRSKALDLLAERLRDAYGDRLLALYALPDDPYEPAGEIDALHVVAVVDDEAYSWIEAQHEINRYGIAFDRQVDYEYVAALKVASASEVAHGATGAARAAREGVSL